jgi:uncharacterized protein with NRDE domain
MCLIALAIAPFDGIRLVVVANRDERLDRPTDAMHVWENGSGVIAGVDREAGGTWLGVSPARGRFAAVTNVRDIADLRPREPGERSRGELVPSFLVAEDGAEGFAVAASREGTMRGFNLLVSDANGIYWSSNRGGFPAVRLTPGIHGLSNAFLDTPWPKVERAKAMLGAALLDEREPSLDALFAILADESRPPDDALPDTGVGLALERELSPIRIVMPTYGTRSSTVFIARSNGTATLVERADRVDTRFDVPFAT